MSSALDYDGLVRVFRAGSRRVQAAADELGRLDSAIGDGDHGVAMKRAMEALEKGMDACGDGAVRALLQAVAMAVMGIDAGSTGPLMGSLLLGMVEPVGDRAEIDAPLLAAMFQGGLAKLRAISKAQVGDKTMIDALVPAVEALEAAAGEGADVPAALARAADAARDGAEKTRDFQAKFGKARNLGERSLGHQDPGATSVSIFLRGLAEGAAG